MGFSQRRSVAQAASQWMHSGREVALATVVASSDSAPRGLGAALAVTSDDLWTGALSGGCAEAEVLNIARELIEGAEIDAMRLLTMTRDELGSAGPVCGSTLTVTVERFDARLLNALEAQVTRAAAGESLELQLTYEAGRRTGVTLAPAPVDNAPRRGLATRWSMTGDDSFRRCDCLSPPPQLVIAGAGDVASELVPLAQAIGWRTVLVDPRKSFVDNTTRLSTPDVVVRCWPDQAGDEFTLDCRTACVAAAHEQRIDVPFLVRALTSSAFYVGSVGSRVTQYERDKLLRERLADDSVIANHRGPAGLNLGGADASEIALSIMSEALAVWNGRSGRPLTDSSEPIRADH